jgi:hypothetical protein
MMLGFWKKAGAQHGGKAGNRNLPLLPRACSGKDEGLHPWWIAGLA